MITGGDEMLRTIRCNNNSYDVDSVGTWLDWTLAQTNVATVAYVQQLLAFRNAHGELHSGQWLDASERVFTDDTGAAASAGYLADATQPVLALAVSARCLRGLQSPRHVAGDDPAAAGRSRSGIAPPTRAAASSPTTSRRRAA